MNFDKLKPREVKTKKLIFKLEIELTNSLLTTEEAEQRIQYLLDSSHTNDVSNFVVFLIRETRSSLWELKKCEITSGDATQPGKDNL